MTIADNYKPIKQETNGTTTDFTFSFYVISQDYIVVLKETNGVQVVVDPSEYTVDFNESGGDIKFKTAPVGGSFIIITRDTPKDQETPFATSSGFPAKTVENRLDKLTSMIQEVSDDAYRALKLPVGTNISPTLPKPSKGKGLVWNETEDGFVNSNETIDDIISKSTEQANIAKAQAEIATQKAEEAKVSETISKESAESASEDATRAEEARRYAEEAITDENLIVVATDLKSEDSNIKNVSENIDNVNALGPVSESITDVAGIKESVVAVAGNKTNIDTLSENITDVSKLANKITDVSNVSRISDAVTIVSENTQPISDVASIKDNVVAVDGNKTNINTVAGKSTQIQTVVDNIQVIQDAPENAEKARIWADGNDTEVQGLGGTHSSMVASGLANAIAQAPEDVPIEEWMTEHQLIVQGEKGDVGPQGPQGQQGPQGLQGPKGNDATINGLNTITLQGSDNISFNKEGSTFTIDTTKNLAEIEAIARGKSQAQVFETFEDMEAFLSNPVNKGVLELGDNLYIIDTEVPDYWVSKVLTEVDPVSGYYYNINQLSSETPDITNMVTTDTVQDITGAKNFTEITKGGDALLPIVSVTEFPESMKSNVLYVKVEE